MISIFLVLFGCFFNEVKASIGKEALQTESIFSLGAILSFFGCLVYITIIFYKIFILEINFSYNFSSIHISFFRIIFDIGLLYIGLQATKLCDRSTFSLLRSLTIPLLFFVDITMGYSFTSGNILGILVIMLSIVFFGMYGKVVRLDGWKYAILFAVGATITTTLYKYNISVYKNSVEIEQLIVFISLFLFFIIQDIRYTQFRSIKIITHKKFLLQGIAGALSTGLISYAYLFMNASIILSIKRSGAILWGIVFGKLFFGEEYIKRKLLFGGCVTIGIFLLIL